MIRTKLSPGKFLARNWPLIIFCLVHAAIVLWLFQSGAVYNKLSVMRSGFNTCEYNYAQLFAAGGLPYRDFSVEYPPVTMFFILLPSFIVSSFTAYLWAYTVEVFLLDLVVIFVLVSLSRRLDYNPWQTLGVYSAALMAAGPILVTRMDFIPAVLTLLSVYFFVTRHNKAAWALLAVAVLTKVYPAVIAPVYFLIQVNRRQKRELFEGLVTFVMTAVVITAPFLLMSENGLLDSFFYHAQRPLQIESTYASILELLYAFKLLPLEFSNQANSLVITGTVPDMLAKFSFGLMVVSLLLVYWSLYRRLKTGHAGIQAYGWADETALAIKYGLISLLVFILTCKVFSPQYIIWLLPLVSLIRQKQQYLVWILFVVACVMTFLVYPQYYDGIREGSLPVIMLLVVRNLTLTGVVFLLLRGRSLKANPASV